MWPYSPRDALEDNQIFNPVMSTITNGGSLAYESGALRAGYDTITCYKNLIKERLKQPLKAYSTLNCPKSATDSFVKRFDVNDQKADRAARVSSFWLKCLTSYVEATSPVASSDWWSEFECDHYSKPENYPESGEAQKGLLKDTGYATKALGKCLTECKRKCDKKKKRLDRWGCKSLCSAHCTKSQVEVTNCNELFLKHGLFSINQAPQRASPSPGKGSR